MNSKERKQQFLDNCKNKWAELCRAHGEKGGFGYYITFIHLDTRTCSGAMSVWDYRILDIDVVYAASLGSFGGVVLTRLTNLKKKMDKHNEVIERTYKLEEGAKSNTHRLDGIEERIDKDVKN